MKKSALVYWLIPAEPERALFRKLIRILSKECDAPRFEPHLSIFATVQDRQVLKADLRKITAKPIRLKICDVGHSPQFTKILFVRFKTNRALDKLIVDLARATGGRAKEAADLHLSLLYKNMPVATKKQLASTIKLPFREVLFDSIKAVRCASPTKTGVDVKAWRVVATRNLGR